MFDPDAVVAERSLVRCDTGSLVVARVFKPVPDPEDPDSTWACGYEIIGLDETVRDRAFGIDSMQALILSFQGIRGALKAGTEVSFADEAGHTGFERHHLDPDMEALFENLMEAEIIRQNLLYEALDGEPERDASLMLDHVREAEAARQRITRRIIERATNRDDGGS
jgi:hypothetical protein